MNESSPKPRKPVKSGPKLNEAPGLATRRAAVDAIDAVLDKGRPLEEALERLTRDLDERDRSLARMIAATVLRRLGTLRRLMRGMMEKPLPSSARRTEILLLVGAAQILLMDVPDHAAVGTTVDLAGEDATSAGFKGLINAVLRRMTREGKEKLAEIGRASCRERVYACV